ncbi:MAG: Fe-S cluster assembly protein SufD [Bacteroidales bacterium]|nr:Fe-S cluster assembly protein SufD [Bacteroidales bacterium]MDY3912905.1 Fe-S cluster assembly protein SufD [Sodaliphilus sp.]
MTNALQQYIDLHDQQQSTLCSHSPEALNAMRSRARQALDGTVLPRKGSDDYEATDLEQVLAPDYGINVNRVAFSADASQAFNCDVPNMSTCMYYFFNDTFARSATASHNLGQGVVVESMAEAAKRHPQLLSHYGTAARLDDPCTALNTMLAQDGIVVYVPDGVAMERPIQLVNIFNAAAPMMAVRRILVVVGRNASARMLVCDHTSNAEVDYLSSQVVEIVAMEGATFDYYDLEESSERTKRLSSVFVTQAAGSNVLVDGITLLNGYTRNNYRFEVNGEHAESHLLGMTIAGGCQHVDNHTFISHNAPRCRSNEMLKYVLNDHSVGAFSGKILVKPGCPRIDAYQGNRNICASPEAKMYTKPQLEIYTDDVKCSHGATVGQLDQEAMFYMRTRGVSEPEARRLLMQAFVSDVVDAVRLESLRDRLRHLVEKRFDGSLATSCQSGDCAASCHRHK